MIISLIAAIGKNNELGKNNALLWRMPSDMKHFREITKGHSIIMGRKTFESLSGGKLPDRKNIVITRNKSYLCDSVDVVNSLEEVINLFKDKNEEIFIIGGAEIYKQTISLADKLYITRINAEDSSADRFFPTIDENIWKEISRIDLKADEKNPYDYSFIIFTRKSNIN